MTTLISNPKIDFGGTAKDQPENANYDNHAIGAWEAQGKTIARINMIAYEKEVVGIVLQSQPKTILLSDTIELPCPPFCPDEEQVLLKDIIA